MEKQKHILSMLLLIATWLFSVNAFAYDAKINGIYYNLVTKAKQAEVTHNPNKYNGTIRIPGTVTYNGVTYSVTSIGYRAFDYCEGLTSITIPNSVTSIGNRAFYSCSGLTSVTIPNSVTSIGEQAFLGCSGLTSVTIGNSVTSIGDYAFSACEGLTSVTIPNSVTSIGNGAFHYCSDLTSVTIPNSVTSIGDYAFYNCFDLTSVTLNNSAIVSKSYPSDSSLGDVFGQQVKAYILGDEVTSIGMYAFRGCSGLTSITIPNSVTSIGKDAFNGCSGLKKVIVPDIAAWCGITFEMDDDYYDYQSNPLYYAKHLYSDETTEITNLIIPNSVKSIGEYAFYKCDGLTSVTIGNSVTTIGQGAFSGCSSLEKVIVPDIAAWCRIEFSDVVSNPLYYAHHLYSDETTEITNLVIPNSVTSIGKNAFDYCSGLTSVTIGNSVTSIGYDAFSRCSGLTSVTIGNSVTSIGYDAFSDCDALTSITIPNSVTSIGDEAFLGCSGLTSVTIGNSVRSISSSVFQDCSALTSVTLNSNALVGSRGYSWNYTLGDIFGQQVKTYILGDEVTSIGDYAFCDCSALISVTIGNSVTSIGVNAFYGCIGLKKVIVPDIAAWCGITFEDNPLYYAKHLYSDETTEITNLIIPNSVTSIGGGAFEYCSGLTSVTIPNSVTIIGDRAFYNCKGLTSVNIPNSVTSIGQQAFSGCEGLTSITIPNSVTSIGISAFNGCSGLTSVTIGNSVTSIGGGAFLGCSGLTSVTIPNSVTSIGLRAFEGCSALTSVNIGNGVKNIGSEAFAYCEELTDVYCYAENVPSTDSDAFAYSNYENATLHVPAASIEQYKATKPWSNFGTIVPLTDEDAIAEVQAVPVLIQTQGNTITVEGAEAGTEIILYGANGVQLDSVVATKGVASLNASRLSGSVAIVKIGNKTVKVLMKQ